MPADLSFDAPPVKAGRISHLVPKNTGPGLLYHSNFHTIGSLQSLSLLARLGSFFGLHRLLAADDVASIDAAADRVYGDRKAAHAAFISVASLDPFLRSFRHFLNRLFCRLLYRFFLLSHALLLSSDRVRARFVRAFLNPVSSYLPDLIEFKTDTSGRKVKFHQDRGPLLVVCIPDANDAILIIKRSERGRCFEADSFDIPIKF